jgi:thioredoxin 1
LCYLQYLVFQVLLLYQKENELFTQNLIKMIVEVNSENYEEIVLQTDKPVLLDFYATWCGPCKILHSTLEKLAEEFKDTAVIAKVNVEENTDITVLYGIKVLPTVMFVNKQERTDNKIVGVRPINEYSDILKELI